MLKIFALHYRRREKGDWLSTFEQRLEVYIATKMRKFKAERPRTKNKNIKELCCRTKESMVEVLAKTTQAIINIYKQIDLTKITINLETTKH